MAWKQAAKITLSEMSKKILEELSKGTHTPLHLKTRAQIVLRSADGQSTNSIKKEMNLYYTTVQLWRNRFSEAQEELERTEDEAPHKLRSSIKSVLSDAQRSGAPSKFTDNQVAAILAMSCEDPAKLGLPFSHWTPELLRIQVIGLGIVEDISIRQIERFLKRKRFKAAPSSRLAESKYRRLRAISSNGIGDM